MQSVDRIREIALQVIHESGIQSLPKDMLKSLMDFLEVEEGHMGVKYAIADKIANIYGITRGQFDIYLNHPKSNIAPETKDLLWKILSQIEDRAGKYAIKAPLLGALSALNSGISTREHLPPRMEFPHFSMPQHMGQGMPQSMGQGMQQPTNQSMNMNMNMMNMFMDVPNLQTVEEIEIFQRKMFEIYKNFMPQVLSSMPQSNQMGYYRPQPSYQSYMGGMPPMGMQGLQNPLQTMQSMNSMQGMQQMNSMGPMNSMQGMMMGPTRNTGMGMMPTMPYQKYNDFYDPMGSFSSRLQNENKLGNNFNSQGRPGSEKSINDFNRSIHSSQGQVPNLGFSFYGGDRMHGDELGLERDNPYKNTFTQSKVINSGLDDIQRKPVYSQKLLPAQQSIDAHLLGPNLFEFSGNSQRDLQISSTPQLPIGHQPRKMVKKDPSANLNEIESELIKESQKYNRNQTQKKKDSFAFYNRLVAMDPLNEVEDVLLMKDIGQEKTQISFQVSLKIMKKLNQNPQKFDIEIRCIKKEEDADNQISWPQRYRLSVNDQVIDEFSNLDSSFRKRKQKSFLYSKYLEIEKSKEETANILLEIRSQKGSNYLLGILFVVKHSVSDMLSKILKSIDKEEVREFFKPKGELTQIQMSLLDSNGKLMREPVRGSNCSHPQCFDLEEFLHKLFNSQGRQWKCPICSQEAKKFVLDLSLKNVLGEIKNMAKEPKSIVFYPNGEHDLKFEEDQAPFLAAQAKTEKPQNQDTKKEEKVEGSCTREREEGNSEKRDEEHSGKRQKED